MFASDADDDSGNYNAFRVGVTRFLLGQRANIKVGVEVASMDNPFIFGDTNGNGSFDSGEPFEDSALTGVLGFYTTW